MGFANLLPIFPGANDEDRHRKRLKTLSRMDVLKQMFDAYTNRLLAYGYQTHRGLVTFRSTPTLTQSITHAIENFRHQLNSSNASGDTALWDAITLGRDMLKQYGAKYPKAKLRLICLSDGVDTKSKQRVHDVALGLLRDGITVDSFCLGNTENLDLQALSYVTGGYKFQPDQMEHAMAICEMEPVLSSLERPDLALQLPSTAQHFAANPMHFFNNARYLVEVDEVSRDKFPQRKVHPLLFESYIELGRFTHGINIANRSGNNLRLTRIHTEIRNSGTKTHAHYDIYICESDFSMWKVVMQGPPGSTYANGTFVLYLEMAEDYPAFPPKGRFITPIYHPNINRHGRICHSIFDRNWTVDTTTKDVIDTVYGLLLTPEFSDPINTVVTLNFHWDEVQ
jgi:ubiquitin-protein ligase